MAHCFAAPHGPASDRPLPLLRSGIDGDGLLWPLPAEYGFAGGSGLIHALDAGGVRRLQDNERVLFDLARDLLHGVDEEIELFLRFALSGLDHQRARNDERKGDSVGVEAVIDEALGDVASFDATCLLLFIAEDDLVHGR